jgi:hypothetical protein
LSNPERAQALLEDMAKRWLAHDGVWFQAVEKEYGLEAAVKLDTEAWEKFTVLEAERIRRFLGLAPEGGLAVLKEALQLRLDWLANEQEIIDAGEGRIVLRTNVCRVQAARRRKNLAFFPCREVGMVQFAGFARTIDPRISTRCLVSPPLDSPGEYYCAWEFSF